MYLYSSDEEDIPFEYVLVTDQNMKLEENETYNVIISVSELSDESREEISQTWPAAESQSIMVDYFSSLKNNITKESIYSW